MKMPPGSKWLLISMLAVFVLQLFFDRGSSALPRAQPLTDLLGLNSKNFRNGAVWQLFSYMFLHSNQTYLHIFMNALMLFFIGPETEREMGTRHFLVMYFLSGIMGGLAFALLNPFGLCVGASGAIFGVLGAMTALHPNRPLTLLLFFIIPITLKTWIITTALIVIQLVVLLSHSGMNIAFDVHIAGGLAGYIYTLMLFRPEQFQNFKHRLKMTGKLKVLDSSNEASPAEVDRVLDKVAEQGLGSLSSKERKILENASRR